MIIHGYFFSGDLVKFHKGQQASLYSDSTQFPTFRVEIDASTIGISEDRGKYLLIRKLSQPQPKKDDAS